jgi:hypothetical protein
MDSGTRSWRAEVIQKSDVVDRYVELYGGVTTTFRFVGGVHAVEVLKWSARAATGGVAIYATVSDDAIGAHRTEFSIGLKPEVDRAALLLAGLADYTASSGEALGAGHTVPTDEPLWDGSEMSAFLLVERDTLLGPLTDSESYVHFLLAIPLFEEERRFKVAHGEAALIAEWRKRQVNFTDPFRPATRLSIPSSMP